MRITRRKKFVIAGVVATSFVGAGSAFAYWTTTGTGTGSAPTGTTNAITVNQTSSVSNLYPGGLPQTLSGDFTNGNDSEVSILRVTAAVTAAWAPQANPAKPACTAADIAIAGNTGASRLVIPSGASKGAWSGLTIALVNGADNQDNCKNVTVPVTYTVVP